MLYRPHFCCHCGEKIIRAKWTPLTSRRFCDFCAIEQKQHDLIPRAVAIAIMLFGAAGLTAYFGGSSPAPQAVGSSLSKVRVPKREPAPLEAATNSKSNSSSNASNTQISSGSSNGPRTDSKQRVPQGNSSTEPVYHCGAMTKKGTACTRRVKIPGRCWQHRDQASTGSLKN